MADAPAAAVETPAAPETPPAEAAPSLREVVKDTPTPATPPAPPPKTYKVKIDGEELEVDEAELTRGYQRGAAARKRFEEASRKEAEYRERLAAIKANPWAPLEEAGLNPDELAAERIRAAIAREEQMAQRAQLPEPVRRQLEEAEQAKAELARLKAQQEQANKGRLDAEAQGHFTRLQTALPQAMEAAGLPKTPEAASMVVQMMQTQVRAKMPVDPAEAARMVADHLYQRNFAMLRSLPPERVVAALGKEALDALQRHLIAKAKGAPPAVRAVPNPSQPASRNPRAPLTSAEWDKLYGPGK